ncbi:MAG: tripartite tricarboxylate transporter substrate-binding protein [Pseudomonadota bacterium]|nr:tripartite tricarboxylate transporter substrate-binding protein [Pseudomonadota bacterium]
MSRQFAWGRRTVLGLLLAMAVTAVGAGEGDDYPKRPIKMILPNAPGSSSDVLGRILAAKLGDTLGQQIVVENHAGAGGLVGMETAKNAPSDGYTIVVATSAATSIAANLHARLPYDPLNDFQYVSTYAVVPNMLVVNPALPVRTLQELIDYSKSKQGDVFMASAGPGSQSHLAGVMLTMMGGFPAVHVPYKGGGASVLAIMSGEAQWTITPASSVVGQAKSGKVRAIAQSLAQRTPLLPDLPPVSDTIPGYSYSGWNGIIVPKATPQPIVAKLRAALLKTLALPELRELFAKQGAEVVTNTPEEFRRLVQAEIETTGKVVKATGLKME